jgi:hypothetical protein
MTSPLFATTVVLAGLVLFRPEDTAAQATESVRYERDLITAAEIQARAPDAKSAYDVVQRLRPSFLRKRPGGSLTTKEPAPIQVYVDGTLRGSVYVLRELISQGVIEIRYLNGPDATIRYGTGHENGAIVVKTGKVL